MFKRKEGSNFFHSKLHTYFFAPKRHEIKDWNANFTSQHFSTAICIGIKNHEHISTENALERVQRVHEPADVLDISFCTRRF